ncbi:MAG TPA: thiamine diphosphokinase [Bacillota bacterium]|nr:thiamine diphosphokinase [Bacillota bacterium]HPF41881.1 thiamine diphosphokinase [Bacillota bacterium]HPJ85646.1 thiamine diphosphokinase [Bacillota bacterium]HPQ61402.1 thiamine diphosphokinase [Bacillota bacterium]HRX91290.1 thiamine diphosphokinase [Candidatus Izemoplasmatales bacterium]
MSRKIKIFAGPNNYDFSRLYFEEADEFIVGVDSGLKYLVENNIMIDLAIGDFDSLDPLFFDSVKQKSRKLITLSKEKSMTDLAYAIDYLYNNTDYTSLEIYGGIGGRIDHLLANINLLKRFDLSFRDNQHHIFVLGKGKHHIDNYHRYISFFAIEDCYNLSLTGFKYSLNNYYLSTSDSLCVSNEGSGEVGFSKGRLLVVMSDEK